VWPGAALSNVRDELITASVTGAERTSQLEAGLRNRTRRIVVGFTLAFPVKSSGIQEFRFVLASSIDSTAVHDSLPGVSWTPYRLVCDTYGTYTSALWTSVPLSESRA
jgi:hypothetical protein